MSDSNAPGLAPTARLGVVAGFMALCAGIFGFLWVNSGGHLPLVSRGGYRVSMDVPRVANLVYFSDVMVAGVKAGKVVEVTPQGDHARVVVELDDQVAPLHRGATGQVRAKSLVEESFVELADGDGPELDSGSTLPDGAVKPAVQLSDVLASFDAPTRARLRHLVRTSGLSTQDTRDGISAAVTGLGVLGRNGGDVTDALADQSADLAELTRSSARVLAALDTKRAQLRSLIADADRVTSVTSGQGDDLADVVRALPPLLRTATSTTGDLQRLAGALTPVAENLDESAPDLTEALRELPATTRALRATVPALRGVLDRAPATLDRVPRFSDDLAGLLPPADAVLADGNPMLGYLARYRRDLPAFFANFAQTIALGDVNGKAFRVMPTFYEQSFKGVPFSTNLGPLNKFNPLPAPDSLQSPGVFSGTYPRVHRR